MYRWCVVLRSTELPELCAQRSTGVRVQQLYPSSPQLKMLAASGARKSARLGLPPATHNFLVAIYVPRGQQCLIRTYITASASKVFDTIVFIAVSV